MLTGFMHNRRFSSTHLLLMLIVAGLLIKLISLGLFPLFDSTESRYAEIGRKMYELNDWITPWYDYGIPFWAKPPMAFWLTAASYHVFGVNAFAARLPHFLLGVAILWVIWGWLGPRRPAERLYACVILSVSVLFFISMGAVMTDMALALSCILMMRGFWLGMHGTEQSRAKERWLLFIGAGIGLLAKGPIACILSGVPIVLWCLLAGRLGEALRSFPWVRGSLLALAMALPWYIAAELKTPGFIDYFIVGEHWHRFLTPHWQGDRYGHAHAFPHGAIWIFILIGTLPWSLLLPLFIGWKKPLALRDIHNKARLRQWYFLIWGLSPGIFFTAAANIIWTYALPGLAGLAMLAASWLARRGPARRVARVLAAGMLIVVVGWSAYLAHEYEDGWGSFSTTRNLVWQYQKEKQPGEPLIGYPFLDYSTEFYTEGNAIKVSTETALESAMQHGKAYVAMHKTPYKNLPDSFKQRLHVVAEHGDYLLLKN
ncbi:glycosyltransferase family 39 protein [Methylovorus menthalis]|uniref:ArnT family glycosyltransferase n=1 Tax=Methylovorus menthalis TaxID=1002227 RepID=UPI001E5D83E8|nr:glycosyltransferase family 39 protein [Methylovorus menthalis]MCB4809984.1 glycosyltransferase family 39 protein [Methylovorus menthalis]